MIARCCCRSSTWVVRWSAPTGSYSQLGAAAALLAERGTPSSPACRRSCTWASTTRPHLLDPDGHLICLYYYMEQVGWDGKPRPQSQRRTAAVPWPETLQLLSDTYADQTYMGPLG